MNAPAKNTLPQELQRRYSDNFARHLLGVSRYLQAEIMNRLTLRHGHGRLRIGYEPYITMAANSGARLSDIADVLGISRQAANQAANQIEASGYISRAPDPSDGRAKLLVVTPRGRALIRQGGKEAARLQARLADIVGQADLERVNARLIQLSKSLGLIFPFQNSSALVLAATLPRLSDFISSRLQALTAASGHPHLKRSFGSVLYAIGPRGGRIQRIAGNQDVSKQAISAIASELEELGYIIRAPDPADARQVVLLFTAAGQQLIADSVRAVDRLKQEFADLIGAEAVEEITTVMARIYQSLNLEQDIFGYADTGDIRIIARELNRQLGEDGAKALARLLLSGEAHSMEEAHEYS